MKSSVKMILIKSAVILSLFGGSISTTLADDAAVACKNANAGTPVRTDVLNASGSFDCADLHTSEDVAGLCKAATYPIVPNCDVRFWSDAPATTEIACSPTTGLPGPSNQPLFKYVLCQSTIAKGSNPTSGYNWAVLMQERRQPVPVTIEQQVPNG